LLRFENRKAATLSGGMKQKLALCCALVHKPKILFLDEPTTGVDPVSRRELWDILKLLEAENISVFVSTSYMDEANLCNRIGLIQNGHLLESNTPKQIQDNFQGYLLALQTNQIYQLLTELENFTLAKDFYAAGQQVNVVLHRREDEKFLRTFLEHLSLKINQIAIIQPSIEDCFIQLMKKIH
jgi:ABC-type multidrug transport system ATPase subunit